VVVAARGVLADQRLPGAVLQVEDLVLEAVDVDRDVVPVTGEILLMMRCPFSDR
jgi:hypothetical protein